MITFNYFVRKKADVSSEDFRNYWLGEHAEKSLHVAGKLGIQKYIMCETLHEDEVNKLLQQLYNTPPDVHDFADQMIINDLEDFKKGLADPEVQAALKAMHESDRAYVNFSRSDYWFSIKLMQIRDSQEFTATWDNTILKAYYVVIRPPHLSMAEAQLHWNSCHGEMARQFAQFLPYLTYQQGHRIESKVAEQFKALLGSDFENDEAMIGQAESWLDRRVVPSLQGPEVNRMMGLLVQDIEQFAIPAKCSLFVGKEHVILKELPYPNQAVITQPVPSLFNAD